MKKEIIYSLSGLYRDDFRVMGYRFGEGEKREKCACIVGAFHGNELQQLYMCGRLVKLLTELEEKNEIANDREILVIPCVNSYGINADRNFWCLDNSDINGVFPGNENGETTERIAAGVFREIKEYKYCVRLASFYISGGFAPHVGTLNAKNLFLAQLFELPFTVVKTPSFLDKVTLDYNLGLSGTAAFSVYTENKEEIDDGLAYTGISAVLRFLFGIGAINHKMPKGNKTKILNDSGIIDLLSPFAGIYRSVCEIGREAKTGDVLAKVYHPYDGEIIGEITTPADGIIFFAHRDPLIAEEELAFKIAVKNR